MSKSVLERIEAELAEIRRLVEKKGRTHRELYPLPEAAELLGVKMTKMHELVSSRVVMTVPLGGRQHVPHSEIERLSYCDPPKAMNPKQKRLAASLSKLREPIPGAREAVIRVRDAKRPRPTQDRAKLEEIIKASNRKHRGR